MTFIRVGDLVRKYDRHNFDDRDDYHPGWVASIDNGIIVDYWDWAEWYPHETSFRLYELYFERGEVLVPVQSGIVIDDYQDWLR